MTEPSTYQGRAQLADRDLARRIDRLADEWVRMPFDPVVALGQRIAVNGTASFTAYATGGVSIPGLASAASVVMQPWTDGAGSVLLFKWNPATHKMLIADWTGTELAAATDISDVVSHPYVAMMESDPSSGLEPSCVFRMTGAGKLRTIELESAADFTASLTAYWTFTARLIRSESMTPQTVGTLIGTYSTQRRSLEGGAPVTLYVSDVGIDLAESDRIVVTAEATGFAAPVVGATIWSRIRRKVA